MLTKNTLKLSNILFTAATKYRIIPFNWDNSNNNNNNNSNRTKLSSIPTFSSTKELIWFLLTSCLEAIVLVGLLIAVKSGDIEGHDQIILLTKVSFLILGLVLKFACYRYQDVIVTLTNQVFLIDLTTLSKFQLESMESQVVDTDNGKRRRISSSLDQKYFWLKFMKKFFKRKFRSFKTRFIFHFQSVEALLELFCEGAVFTSTITPIIIFWHFMKPSSHVNLYIYYTGRHDIFGRFTFALIAGYLTFSEAYRLTVVALLPLMSAVILIVWIRCLRKELETCTLMTPVQILKMYHCVLLYNGLFEACSSPFIIPSLLFGASLVLVFALSTIIIFQKISSFLVILYIIIVICLGLAILFGLQLCRIVTYHSTMLLRKLTIRFRTSALGKRELNAVKPIGVKFSFLFIATQGTALTVFRIITETVANIVITYKNT